MGCGVSNSGLHNDRFWNNLNLFEFIAAHDGAMFGKKTMLQNMYWLFAQFDLPDCQKIAYNLFDFIKVLLLILW